MASKADYLSKYLTGGKKPKRPKRKAESAVVVIDEVEPPAELLEEEPPDEAPVKVDVPATTTFSGFKRIDGKEIKPATVYRDETGRIVDIEEKRKQLQQQKRDEARREEERQRAVRETDLSRLQRDEHERKLKAATSFTVSKSDPHYNAALKQQRRFDDPLSAFTAKGSVASSTQTGLPTYTGGPSPANRFGIAAGWFWDGVDRSLGFEELVMRKRNEHKHSKLQVDDYEIDHDLEG
jgi:pre-mRNA-splicing factor CWC26